MKRWIGRTKNKVACPRIRQLESGGIFVRSRVWLASRMFTLVSLELSKQVPTVPYVMWMSDTGLLGPVRTSHMPEQACARTTDSDKESTPRSTLATQESSTNPPGPSSCFTRSTSHKCIPTFVMAWRNLKEFQPSGYHLEGKWETVINLGSYRRTYRHTYIHTYHIPALERIGSHTRVRTKVPWNLEVGTDCLAQE